ncbi:hypothetical protein VB002_13890 [Campylobacter concisus]
MKKIIFLGFIALFCNGCLYMNERGVSTQYYNDCKEYYDATGTYQKECPHNIVELEIAWILANLTSSKSKILNRIENLANFDCEFSLSESVNVKF